MRLSGHVILSVAKNPAKIKGCNWILRYAQDDELHNRPHENDGVVCIAYNSAYDPRHALPYSRHAW